MPVFLSWEMAERTIDMLVTLTQYSHLTFGVYILLIRIFNRSEHIYIYICSIASDIFGFATTVEDILDPKVI